MPPISQSNSACQEPEGFMQGCGQRRFYHGYESGANFMSPSGPPVAVSDPSGPYWFPGQPVVLEEAADPRARWARGCEGVPCCACTAGHRGHKAPGLPLGPPKVLALLWHPSCLPAFWLTSPCFYCPCLACRPGQFLPWPPKSSQSGRQASRAETLTLNPNPGRHQCFSCSALVGFKGKVAGQVRRQSVNNFGCSDD